MQYEQVLPNPGTLRCDGIQIAEGQITITVSSRSPDSCCPVCGTPSQRVHSRYRRTLADLPWHGLRVQLLWNSRRLFCDDVDCPRRIFTDRLPEVAAPYARGTRRLMATLRFVGLACGGAAGSRLAARLGMRTSGDTLLRTIRRSRCSEHPTPRVLGVDDWSYRRGHRCGTILCDLERRQPVDLLPERSPECFSAWLDQHRGVEIITPDRGDAYLKGATVGAPQAVQVADRFHLVRNLREALCRVMERHSTDVQAALRTVSRRKFSALCGKSDPAVPIGEPSPTKPTPPEVQFQQQRRAERIQRYEQVVELHRQGVSLREIGRRLGLHRETAERFVRAGKYPERAPRMYRRGPDAYREYLQRRWEAGCCNALQLTRELRAQGFAGSYDSVRRYVAGWRTWQTAQPGIVAARAGDFSMQRPPVHRLVSWMLRHDRQLADDEAALVNILCEQCPDLRTAAELSREFETLLRNRQSVEFDQWLEKASAEHIPKPLRRFAAGLRNDLTAVRAAVTLPWSNGQVKGQVNRLKLIKRQMYGRANFDLLRQRVLFAG